jgi:hypothetical protein
VLKPPERESQPTPVSGLGNADFMFEMAGPRMALSELHPSPGDAMILWSIFLENIDPLVKVVHPPTLEPEFRNAIHNPRTISESLEALMFSIYSSAILSMTSTDCEQAFGISKSILATRFETGAKKSFMGAGLFISSDFRLLQAYVIWLVSFAVINMNQIFLMIIIECCSRFV